MPRIRSACAFVVAALAPSFAFEQAPAAAAHAAAPPAAVAPIRYGAPIKLEAAKSIMAAAQAEPKKNEWPVAISIVDGSGFPVAFQRLDDAQLADVEASIEKAETAATFRRPTTFFEEAIEKGGAGLKVRKLPGALPVEGGLPIVHEGKAIGVIGVWSVASTQNSQVAQDAQAARAGLAALEAPSAEAPK